MTQQEALKKKGNLLFPRGTPLLSITSQHVAAAAAASAAFQLESDQSAVPAALLTLQQSFWE